jgi:hypothetical protein
LEPGFILSWLEGVIPTEPFFRRRRDLAWTEHTHVPVLP